MRKLLLLSAAGTFLLVTAAYAHHSLAATYDTEKEVKLEGKIADLLLRNPHSFLQIDAPDAGGVMQRWSLEWRSSGQLGQQGRGEVNRLFHRDWCPSRIRPTCGAASSARRDDRPACAKE